MMGNKRSRACEECHRLKIKCHVNGASCERCSRLRLDCVPAAPRLQRDRINELEALVQELGDALRDKSSSATPGRSPGSLLENDHIAVLNFLDARISLDKQQELLHVFVYQAGAAWPVVRPSLELDVIRASSPVLLLAVMSSVATQESQGTELDVHDELVRETMHILGHEVIGRGQRSLQLVQALLVVGFWSKSTRKGQQGSAYQIIQLAADMAIDLGIGGLSLLPSPAAYFCRHPDPTSLEARRTWLACFLALSASSLSMRRPNTVPWNAYHQECVFYSESRGEPFDILLCQLVRINQLIEEISTQLSLCQVAIFTASANDWNTHAIMETLENKVDNWAAQVPPSLASSQTLQVWRHMAMINIYEILLHTPTNKASFAAPFIPGRIPIKDFPTPTNIIPPTKTALIALIHHCHAVINTATEMDPALALSLPSFCFAPTVLYALFVLVTTMVAATDPANTYGQVVAKDNFCIEQCGEKLRRLTAGIKLLDPSMSCYTTRMFDATSWLEEWYNDYIAILGRYEGSLVGS